MKNIFVYTFILVAVTAAGQPANTIVSDVYSWQNLPTEKKQSSERKQILQGSGPVLKDLEIHATTIEAGKAAHAPHKHPEEELIIVKEGTVKMTIRGRSELLGPGSVALAIPGDEHGLENAGGTRATYYVFRFTSKDSANPKRGAQAGGSFMINWDTVRFTPHDKGGIRRFFERATTMIRRAEMHVSTLNPGIKSHDPHTHRAEEIVLLVEGSAEMQIGETFKKVAPGDLIYLGSNVLHAIRNDGTKPCIYYAFQWN